MKIKKQNYNFLNMDVCNVKNILVYKNIANWKYASFFFFFLSMNTNPMCSCNEDEIHDLYYKLTRGWVEIILLKKKKMENVTILNWFLSDHTLK